MSFQAQAWAVEQKTGNPLSKAVLMALANYANQDGESWYSYARIAQDTEMAESTVRKHVRDLTDLGFLEVEPRTRSNGSSSSNLYRLRLDRVGAMREHPGCREIASPPPTRSTPEPSREPSTESPVVQSSLELELHSSTVRPTGHERKTDPDQDGRFDEFWAVYPRHTAKGTARTAWRKAVKKTDPDQILKGAMRYRDDPNRDARFTKHPATWLNGECWGDEPLPPRDGPLLPANGYWPEPESSKVAVWSSYWPS